MVFMRGGIFLDVVFERDFTVYHKRLGRKNFSEKFSCLLNSDSYDFFKPQYVLEINEFISCFNIFIQKNLLQLFIKKIFC